MEILYVFFMIVFYPICLKNDNNNDRKKKKLPNEMSTFMEKVVLSLDEEESLYDSSCTQCNIFIIFFLSFLSAVLKTQKYRHLSTEEKKKEMIILNQDIFFFFFK